MTALLRSEVERKLL